MRISSELSKENEFLSFFPKAEVPARLACSRFVSYEMWVQDEDPRSLAGRVLASLRHELGLALIDTLMGASSPTVVRMTVVSSRDHEFMGDNIGLIADLQAVQTMEYRILELPPFEFVSSRNNKPVVEWQCAYCGQVNLLVEHLECRKCGAPRKAMR